MHHVAELDGMIPADRGVEGARFGSSTQLGMESEFHVPASNVGGRG